MQESPQEPIPSRWFDFKKSFGNAFNDKKKKGSGRRRRKKKNEEGGGGGEDGTQRCNFRYTDYAASCLQHTRSHGNGAM